MKRFLLTFLCVCSFLALPVFAQDQPKPDQNELIQASILKPWTGDFDGMIERRVIRALVAPSRTSYWLNGPRQTGAEYELLKAFQEEINNHYKAKGKHILIHVVFIPTSRDQLIPGLLEGRGRHRGRHPDRHTGTARTGGFWRAFFPRSQGNRRDGTCIA